MAAYVFDREKSHNFLLFFEVFAEFRVPRNKNTAPRKIIRFLHSLGQRVALAENRVVCLKKASNQTFSSDLTEKNFLTCTEKTMPKFNEYIKKRYLISINMTLEACRQIPFMMVFRSPLGLGLSPTENSEFLLSKLVEIPSILDRND